MIQVRSHRKSLMVVIFIAIVGFAFLIYYEAISKGKDSSDGSEENGKTTEVTMTPKPSPIVISTDSEVVPDDNLEISIRQQIDKPTGPLEESDFEKIIELVLRGVDNIKGIEKCTNLTYLDFNQWSDDSPEYDSEGNLVALPTAVELNNVRDISPLLNNPGLGKGDKIDLRSLRLTKKQIEEDVTELMARGVEVLFDVETPSLPESEMIEFVLPRSWIIENDQRDDPSRVKITFPVSWLTAPPEIAPGDSPVTVRLSKFTFDWSNTSTDPDMVTLEVLDHYLMGY